jgi:ankyrin repeat protein
MIQKIQKMIDEDPKRHMYNIDSVNHILNRKNAQKQTPLYVASKHGHLDVVQYLLE